jgi:hypothetical protein
MRASHPSSMPSRAFPRLQPRQAMRMRTSFSHHRTAHASATDDVPLWAASTSPPTTIAKDITGVARRIDLVPGRRSPTHLQDPFLHRPLPLQHSTFLLGHRAQLHRRHLPRLPHRLHSLPRLHDGIASAAELPDRPSNLPPKSRRHIPATLARADLVSRTLRDTDPVRRGEEGLLSLTTTLEKAQGAGSYMCWVEATQRTTQFSPRQVCSPTPQHTKT